MAAAREIPDFIADICEFKEENDGLSTYLLKPTLQDENEENQIQVLTLGSDNAKKETSCVLLLGETGAGKTRLLNVLVNHIFGVQFEDSFRLALEDQMVGERPRETCSQTDYITAFIIYHQNGMLYDSNFIFIDTPGFSDTRGQEYQKDFMENLRIFLLEDFGIDFLSCIGLLMKASENRELSGQKEVLLSISTLLEDSVAPVTRLLGTFATGDKRDTVIDKIARMADIQFTNLHCFDNWPLYIPHQINEEFTEDDLGNLKYKWKKMNNECEKFLNGVKSTQQVSLLKIRELVKERQNLEKVLEELGKQVKKAAKIIKDWKKRETESQHFKEILEGYHVHICNECDQTCVDNCKFEPKDTYNALTSGAATGAATGFLSGFTIFGVLVGGVTGFLYSLLKEKCGFNKEEHCTKRECRHLISKHSVGFKISQDGMEKIVDRKELQEIGKMIKRIEENITKYNMLLVSASDTIDRVLKSLLFSTEVLNKLSSNSQVCDPFHLLEKLDLQSDGEVEAELHNSLIEAMARMVHGSSEPEVFNKFKALVK